MRNFRVWKQLSDSKKAFVGFDLSVRVNFQITGFQDLEIVCCSSGAAHRENQPGQETNQQKSFYSMFLFFPE